MDYQDQRNVNADPQTDQTLRAVVEQVENGLKRCHNALERIEDRLHGPTVRPVEPPGRDAPRPPRGARSMTVGLIDLVLSLENRLDKLADQL